MRIKLGFRQTEDERFIVTAAVYPASSAVPPPLTSQTLYEHENSFLENLIAADLEPLATQELAIAAILSVARPQDVIAPVQVDLTPQQAALLGLTLQEPPEPAAAERRDLPTERTHPFAFHASPELFHDFLMNAPTPFAMVIGPEHTFTFINQPYTRILGRTSPDQLLGRPIGEALPELCGQTCLAVLDETYTSGIPQVRRDLLSRLRQQDTGLVEEVYFDIAYHPVRDRAGRVTGVMAQATDVTERVLSRQVSEDREQNLYRLWAELGTVYQAVPVGLAVVTAAELRILRLNRLQAEFLGGNVDALAGAVLTQVPSVPNELIQALRQAARSSAVTNPTVEVFCRSSASPEQPRVVRIRCTLDASGAVETLILITLPEPAQAQDGPARAALLPSSHEPAR